MDAFYASVEQRDRPELRGKPVIVGGSPNSRGVVCAASYEARVFGVRSAMPCAQAYRLCRHAVFVKPEMAKYKAASEKINEVFAATTDLVEPLSLDEAYLDVTENHLGNPSATLVAEAIRREILALTGLTASAGVAPNKFLAKVASDLDKPDGLVVIPPERVAEILVDLPVRRVPGVGRVTEQSLARFGIKTCSDLRAHSREQLCRWFGRAGEAYFQLARGIDPRPVRASRERKSVSVEQTFAADRNDVAEARETVGVLAGLLSERLVRAETRGRTVTLKVKYADFQQVTRSRTLAWPVRERAALEHAALELLADTEVGRRPFRLLGLGVSQLGEERQLVFEFVEAMRRGEGLVCPPEVPVRVNVGAGFTPARGRG